jgi:hypothetical protein
MTERHYKFAVVENDYAPPSDRYQAAFDDFDLDCKTGSGPTPEEAIMDYLALHDLPKEEKA